jgi:hypothetical protein
MTTKKQTPKAAKVRPKEGDEVFTCFFDGMGPGKGCIENNKCPYLEACKEEADE